MESASTPGVWINATGGQRTTVLYAVFAAADSSADEDDSEVTEAELRLRQARAESESAMTRADYQYALAATAEHLLIGSPLFPQRSRMHCVSSLLDEFSASLSVSGTAVS